jgi:3-hydroxyisobutyrate dehydrogenase-like beta-hydroxyacid dehydrogenase
LSELRRICLLGFGEVGQVLAADLPRRAAGTSSPGTRCSRTPSSGPSRAAATGLARASVGAPSSVAAADLVVSAVTAAQCVAAAADAAPALTHGRRLSRPQLGLAVHANGAAARIENAGGRYVEAAVMSPIGPKRIASPMLLGVRTSRRCCRACARWASVARRRSHR